MKLERKTLALPDFKMLGEDGPGEFEGFGSVYGNKDSQGDICEPGCFRNAIPDFLKSGFIADGHDWQNDIAMPLEAVEDRHGLRIRAQFHSDPVAQQRRVRVMERIAAGKSVQLSVGYSIRPGGAEQKADGRHLTDLRLFEVSVVAAAANDQCLVTSAKAYSAGLAGLDAEPPEGSYEELAEDLAEAYAAANGLPEERVQVVATFPGHAVLCVCPDYSGDMGPMGETEYWDVPYSGTDEPLTLGTPTAVDPQLSYVPSDDAGLGKALWLPLLALKAGARHGKPTRQRYAAMMTHATALVDHIGSLQAESAPKEPPSKADGTRLYGEYLAWEARRLGVAV